KQEMESTCVITPESRDIEEVWTSPLSGTEADDRKDWIREPISRRQVGVPFEPGTDRLAVVPRCVYASLADGQCIGKPVRDAPDRNIARIIEHSVARVRVAC